MPLSSSPGEPFAPSSFRNRSQSVISAVQAAIANDLAYTNDLRVEEVDEPSTESSITHTQHSLIGSYRRPSYILSGSRSVFAPLPELVTNLSLVEQEDALKQERNLLRDNEIIGERPTWQGRRGSVLPWSIRKFSSTGAHPTSDQPENHPTYTETSTLLGQEASQDATADASTIAAKWEESVTAGVIFTTWQRETKVLGGYCAPLMITFLLQYSLTMASIFTVGRLGTAELGAVSLAAMSANISGYAIYQGLSVSLDTLCAQAYGSGRKSLVGLQMQRMIFLLWLITIPIGVIWLLSDRILYHLVPEPEVAVLAGRYLKVLLIGAPGFACFEAGKRFVQAQGIFTASLYVLCVCAPLNAFMNWLFVWELGWGFIGAPIAVAITDNLLPLGLYVYVRFFSKHGMDCWGGFTYQAFRNWTPMIKLAIPALTMIEAEILASEILTLLASYFGVTYLAAQSVLATITALAFQVPFPLSVAASTRIANLIGATLGDAARSSANVAIGGAVIVGAVNASLLAGLRWYIPKLFTNDEEVIELVAKVLPVCAAFQLFDSLAACTNGILRGLGRQEIGAYTQLLCYYAVGLPISVSVAFKLNWHLYGLWTGNAIALASVTVVEMFILSRVSWSRAVEEAKARMALDRSA